MSSHQEPCGRCRACRDRIPYRCEKLLGLSSVKVEAVKCAKCGDDVEVADYIASFAALRRVPILCDTCRGVAPSEPSKHWADN